LQRFQPTPSLIHLSPVENSATVGNSAAEAAVKAKNSALVGTKRRQYEEEAIFWPIQVALE
jgi:hypothetical protein